MNEDITNALEILRKGGVILYPSDTGWVIGCDATNSEAVARIYSIIQNPDPKNIVVLMENPALLDRFVDDVPEIAWDLIEITTTPLTIIFSNARNIAENLIAEDGSIRIRFTKEKFTRTLLNRFRKPLVSAPAGISEEKAPLQFDEIPDEIRSQTDFNVLFNRNTKTAYKPASIIKLFEGGRIEIIRK